MLGKFIAENTDDKEGNPAGGLVHGTGLYICWQNGPLGRGEDRKKPNGAFVETVIAAVIQRIEYYQTASGRRFACQENEAAIQHLEVALEFLNQRTQQREARDVEGTHQA